MTLMSTIRHQRTVTGSVCRPCLHAFNFSFHLVADVRRRRRRLYSFPICYFPFFFLFYFLGGKDFSSSFWLFVIWLGNEPKNEEKKKWLAASRETWSLVAGNETYTHTHTVQARRCCDRGEKEEEESFSYFFFCLLVTSFGGGNSAGTTSHLTHSRRFITNRHTEKKKKKIF